MNPYEKLTKIKEMVDHALSDSVATGINTLFDIQELLDQPEGKEKTVTCYMDGIDWQHHLGADPDGTRLFATVEDLKEEMTCVTTGGCGIVEVEVKLVSWVEPQDIEYVEVNEGLEASKHILSQSHHQHHDDDWHHSTVEDKEH